MSVHLSYFSDLVPIYESFLGAKTSLFRYLINQKRNNFIKHCPPVYQQADCIRNVYIYIRHNIYKWGLDSRGEQCSTDKK